MKLPFDFVRRVLAVCLVVTMLLCIAGCKSSSGSETSSVPEPVSSEPEPEIDSTTKYGEEGKTLAELYGENDDTIGWLTIPGIKTDNVVMMGVYGKSYPNDDGSTTSGGRHHYLNYNFNHERTTAGELFIDDRATVKSRDEFSQNLVIYGHHMRDGTMLAGLDNYRSKSFFDEHQYITFNTLWDKHHWRVFTVFMVDLTTEYGRAFDYILPQYKATAFDDYVSQYKQRQYYDTGVELKPDDVFITLSTCTYPTGRPAEDNARLVVCARMCTPEEEAALAEQEVSVEN